jgi:ATP-dependent Clp protease adaptor protein ClpS
VSPSFKKDKDGGVGVAEPKTKAKPKLARPKLYKVLLHNDNFTPMEFVVLVLREVFGKSEADSEAIMLHAHTHGFAVAGIYSHEIAETKVEQTMALADKQGFPLLCTMEPDDAPQDE